MNFSHVSLVRAAEGGQQAATDYEGECSKLNSGYNAMSG